MTSAGHTNTQIARRLGLSEGHRPHAPGKHLYPAASLQSHSRSHPRLPRPGLTPRSWAVYPRVS